MNQTQKDYLEVKDEKVIKVLKKPLPRKIIDCFYDTPLSAPEIAEAVSFPKDKIYYHIKKLISLKIIFIVESINVNGIEQKKFLPVAKQIRFADQKLGIISSNHPDSVVQITKSSEKVSSPTSSTPELDDITHLEESVKTKENHLLKNLLKKREKNNFPVVNESLSDQTKKKSNSSTEKTFGKNNFKRIIDDRRRSSDRRNKEQRRDNKERRKKQIFNYGVDDRRGSTQRRKFIDRRTNSNRRFSEDRRLDDDNNLINNIEQKIEPSKRRKRKQSLILNNTLLHLNGITNAMTFVQTGKNITFMHAQLGIEDFHIIKTNNYRLPISGGEHEITTLPELILNIYDHHITKSEKKNIYLAIHSSNYNYEMTYVNTEDQKKSEFKEFLLYTLAKSYSLDTEKCMVSYNFNGEKENSAVICYSPYKEHIENDHNLLHDSGLNIRYNTSIPRILQNLYNYYNPEKGDGNTLLIYVDQVKTHLALLQDYKLVESRDFSLGLDNFLNPLIKLVYNNQETEKDIKNKALDFLERYGVALPETRPSELDMFPWEEAQKVLTRLGDRLRNELIGSKKYFSNVRQTMAKKKMLIRDVYVGGPGSHINNVDKLIGSALNIKVNRLDELNTSKAKNKPGSDNNLISQIRQRNIYRKKEKTVDVLEDVREKIMGHKKAIETATSPESVKYRLARLEIDKNSKIKSIEEATKKLIQSAGEFKGLKDDYAGTQETLSADLETVTKDLDRKSEALLEKYQEHEYLVRQISKTEYETDQFQKKRNEARKRSKGEYSSQLKKSANSRLSIVDRKDKLERKVADQQDEVIKNRENLQKISNNLEKVNDEISLMEYLLDTVQRTASALQNSLLSHLANFENLRQSDLNNLEQAEYMLTINIKRLSDINHSFLEQVSGDKSFSDFNHIDEENAFETRKKLTSIIDIIISIPINLEQIKKTTIEIININDRLNDLNKTTKELKNQILLKRGKKEKEEGRLKKLNREIDHNKRMLKDNESSKQKCVKALELVQDAITGFEPLSKKEEKEKEGKKKQLAIIKELKSIQIQLTKLGNTIIQRKRRIRELNTRNSRQRKEHQKKQAKLNILLKQFSTKEDKIKVEIIQSQQSSKVTQKKLKELDKELNKLKKNFNEKLIKQKQFKSKETIILREVQKIQKRIQADLNRKLKNLEKQKDKLNIITEKNKKFKFNSFTKDLSVLRKKEKSIQDILGESGKEIKKIYEERDRLKSAFLIKRKEKAPKIKEWKNQLRSLKSDLKKLYTLQEKFDSLEEQRNNWEETIEKESKESKEKISELESQISHKRSDSYLLLIKEGLTRFNNEADSLAAARSISKESISLDQDEIKDIKKVLNDLNKKYQSFLKRYRSRRKTILADFRQFQGKEKSITNKINNTQKKIDAANQLIHHRQEKLDAKNNQIEKLDLDYLNLQEKARQKLIDVRSSIDQLRVKQDEEQENINLEMEEKIADLNAQKSTAENEYLDQVQALNIEIEEKKEIIEKKEFDSLVDLDKKFYDSRKKRFKKLRDDHKKILKSLSEFKKVLVAVRKRIPSIKVTIKDNEKKYKILTDQNIKKIEIIKKELEQKKEDELISKESKREMESSLRNLNKEVDLFCSETINQRKKIMGTVRKLDLLLHNNKLRSSKKRTTLDYNKLAQDLIKKEHNLNEKLKKVEKNLGRIEGVISLNQEKQEKKEYEIKELNEGMEELGKDLDKNLILITDNQNDREEVSLSQNAHLETLSNFKNVCPHTKEILIERIEVLYDLIEKKTDDKKNLSNKVRDLEDSIKSRKIDINMLEKELTQINTNMKKVLEYSVYEQDPNPKPIEIIDGDTEYKLRSYMDLAEMKARSQDLFEEIIDTEQDVARLKKKSSSVHHVLQETEQISQKKIKRLETECKKLEIQIGKDKNELEDLNKSLSDLKEHTSNYNDRIEILQKELKKFREKETKNEIFLRDLDRSIEQIQLKSKKIINKESNIKDNNIELDYMANLGLLMDTESQLNLVPDKTKKDFKYFALNRILQNVILVLVVTFSISAYSQRTGIEPMKSLLPDKQQELSLLNVRKDIKQIMEKQNMVADAFQVLIDEDQALSSNIILTLKYLSNSIPKGFEVTSLVVDKNISEYINIDTLSSEGGNNATFIIGIEGFINQSQTKSERISNLFRSDLIQTKIFKNVFFSTPKEINKWKTAYTINLVI